MEEAACVRDCPMGILQLKDGRPSVREEKAAGCIVCRHCLAVCPTDAIGAHPRAAGDDEVRADRLQHPPPCDFFHAHFAIDGWPIFLIYYLTSKPVGWPSG